MGKNFDANATYGLHPEVQSAVAALLPRLNAELLNPSAAHQAGQRARLLLDEARDHVRDLVGASSQDAVIFTSGATESNNQALVAPFLALAQTPQIDREQFSLLTSCVEHESIIDAAARVRRLGFPVTVVTPRSPREWITVNDVVPHVDARVKVASFIHGQNEIGTLLPIAQIAATVREKTSQALIHCDAVQTVGRIPIVMEKLGVDALSISGHKIGALAGIGALIVRKSMREAASALLVGGAQEQRLRAGTENVLGAYSLGVAARIAKQDIERGSRMRAARSALRDRLYALVPGLEVHGEFGGTVECLPNTLCISLPQDAALRGDDVVMALDIAGYCISTGSACSSGKQEGNRTLRALGFADSVVRSAVRISMRGDESAQDLHAFADQIARCVARARASLVPTTSSNGVHG